MKIPTFAAIAFSMATLGVTAGAQAEPARKLFFEGDIVRHALAGQAGPFCVLANQFKRKEAVGWRIRVLDPTGAVADDKVLKGVLVELVTARGFPRITVRTRRPRQDSHRPTISGRCTGKSQQTSRPGLWVTRSLPR